MPDNAKTEYSHFLTAPRQPGQKPFSKKEIAMIRKIALKQLAEKKKNASQQK